MQHRIAAILAGGRGRRLGGADKGTINLGDRRLIDHVYPRLAPQVDEIVIAGRHDYGLGCAVFPDQRDGPRGPAAALFAVCKSIPDRFPETKGFITVPVDAPFLPDDLVERLITSEGSAVAATSSGIHPTFAYWDIATLKPVLTSAEKPSLRDIARQVGAEIVRFEEEYGFININTPEDLAEAHKILSAD